MQNLAAQKLYKFISNFRITIFENLNAKLQHFSFSERKAEHLVISCFLFTLKSHTREQAWWHTTGVIVFNSRFVLLRWKIVFVFSFESRKNFAFFAELLVFALHYKTVSCAYAYFTADVTTTNIKPQRKVRNLLLQFFSSTIHLLKPPALRY